LDPAFFKLQNLLRAWTAQFFLLSDFFQVFDLLAPFSFFDIPSLLMFGLKFCYFFFFLLWVLSLPLLHI